MLVSVLYIAFGAIFGALLRFLVTHFASELSHHHGFPYGTLTVNVVGCVIVGYVLTWTGVPRARPLATTYGHRILRSIHHLLRVRLREHGLLARR